jgi:hypothetical protein
MHFLNRPALRLIRYSVLVELAYNGISGDEEKDLK